MALSKIFDIAGSAMSAQSVRLNLTASNLANADSVATKEEEAYRARHPVFEAAFVGAQEERLGVNPYRFGFSGATDSG